MTPRIYPKSLEMQLGDKRANPVGHSDLHFVGIKGYVPRLFDATHPHELSFSVIGGEWEARAKRLFQRGGGKNFRQDMQSNAVVLLHSALPPSMVATTLQFQG